MKKGRIQKRETDIQREIKRIEKMEQEKVKTIIFLCEVHRVYLKRQKKSV